MIFCKELNKSFETKELMFHELKKHVPELIKLKKEAVYKSCEKGMSVSCKPIKSFKEDETKAASFEIDDDYYYIAVNSCWVLDSHDDLHIKGIWDEDIEQGEVFLLVDHDTSMDCVVVKKAYIERFIATVPFKSLNKPYEGSTQVLVYKFRKDKVIHQTAKDWLESGDDIEASVRMRYDDIEFAMDSNHPDDAPQKKLYDTYFPKIVNSDEFEYVYYFFVIKKARNVKESSLVIFGSNSATGNIISIKSIDPAETSQKTNKSNFYYNLIH